MENIGIYEWTVVLLGMGTVFVALIGLSLILSGFSLVARIRAKKETAADSGNIKPDASGPPPAPATGVSLEVVAAITAAIAASTGRKPSEIRIARVALSPSGPAGLNTPVWGYANRLAAGRR